MTRPRVSTAPTKTAAKHRSVSLGIASDQPTIKTAMPTATTAAEKVTKLWKSGQADRSSGADIVADEKGMFSCFEPESDELSFHSCVGAGDGVGAIVSPPHTNVQAGYSFSLSCSFVAFAL